MSAHLVPFTVIKGGRNRGRLRPYTPLVEAIAADLVVLEKFKHTGELKAIAALAAAYARPHERDED